MFRSAHRHPRHTTIPTSELVREIEYNLPTRMIKSSHRPHSSINSHPPTQDHSQPNPTSPYSLMIESNSEKDLIHPFDHDLMLDRLISITNQLIDSSNTALATTKTSRDCLSSFSKFQNLLDRSIRTRERDLQRSLESIREYDQTLDQIQRDLLIICPPTLDDHHHHRDRSSDLDHHFKIYQERTELTRTILKFERETVIKLRTDPHHPQTLHHLLPSPILDSRISLPLSPHQSHPDPLHPLRLPPSIDYSRLLSPTSTANTFPIHVSALPSLPPSSTPLKPKSRPQDVKNLSSHTITTDSNPTYPSSHLPSTQSAAGLQHSPFSPTHSHPSNHLPSSPSESSSSSSLSPIRLVKRASTAFLSLYPSNPIPSPSSSLKPKKNTSNLDAQASSLGQTSSHQPLKRLRPISAWDHSSMSPIPTRTISQLRRSISHTFSYPNSPSNFSALDRELKLFISDHYPP